MAPDALRVVLAEDGELIRAGVAALLAPVADIDVVATATSEPELLAAVDHHHPDVVLTDIRMPPTFTDEGIRAAGALRRTQPSVGVVVLTQHADVEYALELIAEGSEGRGYLLKERIAHADQIASAIRSVAAAGSVIDETVVSSLVQAGTRRRHSPLTRLTPRELEVLSEVAQGRTNHAIAVRLAITERSVEKHVNSILAKLDLAADDGTHRRVAATLVYLNDVGLAAPAEALGSAGGPAAGRSVW